MKVHHIWALDSDFLRSHNPNGLDTQFVSLDHLLNNPSLDQIKALILEPSPPILKWLKDNRHADKTPPVFLLCEKEPPVKVLNQFYSSGIQGCFTASEMGELRDCLDDILGYPHEASQSNPLHVEWIFQLRKHGVITHHPTMLALYEIITRVAKTDATVLITGENGTGKEVVARLIHALSKRKSHTFTAVHTGAIPENLLESELFGHVRGAFTSAVKDRKGKFEATHGGTIFLDEISTMPPSLQIKLLRVLQAKQFERVGDNQLITSDVRIISATNSDLSKMVFEGNFREDLFYRLNVIPIHLPALRDRTPDIPILSTHFMYSICQKYAIPLKRFSLGALKLLQAYHWPGNIRQLENVVERMIVLHPDVTVFMPKHIPSEITDVPDQIKLDNPRPQSQALESVDLPLPQLMKNIEKKLILESLQKTKWNKQQAAKLLKINRTTLIEKMKRLEELDEE